MQYKSSTRFKIRPLAYTMMSLWSCDHWPTIKTFLYRLAKLVDEPRIRHHTVQVLVLVILVLQVADGLIDFSVVSLRSKFHQFLEALQK